MRGKATAHSAAIAMLESWSFVCRVSCLSCLCTLQLVSSDGAAPLGSSPGQWQSNVQITFHTVLSSLQLLFIQCCVRQGSSFVQQMVVCLCPVLPRGGTHSRYFRSLLLSGLDKEKIQGGLKMNVLSWLFHINLVYNNLLAKAQNNLWLVLGRGLSRS